MKICFVSAFPPNRGLSEYSKYLVNALEERKELDQIVVLANEHKDALNTEHDGKLKIVRCWKDNSLTTPFRILITVIKENPDLVHFNIHMRSWGTGRVVNFMGAATPYIVKTFSRKKVVVTLHNIVEAVDLNELGVKNNLINRIGAYAATRVILSSDRIVTTLKRFQKLLGKKYKTRNLVTIYLGTPGKQVDKIKTGGRTILSFGYWSNPKNLPFLIDTFREMKKEDRKLKLIVAGGSHPHYKNYLEDIKRRYEKLDGIEFTGYVPEKDIRKVFERSSVVVLPYTTALGTSAVAHLAAGYGKPVIMTDLPESRKLSEEMGFELILFPKNDKEALKEEIKKLLGNKSKQKSIIQNNLKVAEDNSFGNISKQYVEMYKEVIRKG